jgi:hypothetical protein
MIKILNIVFNNMKGACMPRLSSEKPKLVMVGFSTSEGVKATLEELAKAEDRTLSYIVRGIVEKAVERMQQEQKPS